MWNLWLRSHLSSASGLRNKTRTSLRLYLLPLLRLSLLPDPLILLCPRFSYTCTVGTGISACYPSPTPLGLSLGPDLPWADEPSPGNLRLSTGMFLACLALLIPAFSLLCRPQLLSVLLLPAHNAPLPIVKDNSKASVTCFSPVTSSAHNYSTSELLRTLLMSGCF